MAVDRSAGTQQSAPPPLLISVHMPKTAGSSLRAALQSAFGQGFQPDNDDRPLHMSRPRRELNALRAGLKLAVHGGVPAHVSCIHGHFLALKYLALTLLPREVRFACWLRDPVERVASHYRYWMNNRDGSDLPALHRRVVEEDWTLERFCLAHDLRNLYCQFLFGFPRGLLSFVGITERTGTDYTRLRERYLGGRGPDELPRVNLGTEGGARHIDEGPFRRRVEAFHSRDVALYRYYLRRS